MSPEKVMGIIPEKFISYKVVNSRTRYEYAQRDADMHINLRDQKYKRNGYKPNCPKAAQPVEHNRPKQFFNRGFIGFVDEIHFVAIATYAAREQEIIKQA